MPTGPQLPLLWTGLLCLFFVVLIALIVVVGQGRLSRIREKNQDLQAIYLSSTGAQQHLTPVRPKIVIITLETRPLHGLLEIHNRTVQEYAAYHGYEYRFLENFASNMPVFWHKIEWMLEILKEEPNVDAVLWLDSDTMISQGRIPLTALFAKKPDASIYIGFDGGPWDRLFEKATLNAGVFLVKNTEAGRAFLESCLHTVRNNPQCSRDGKIVLNSRWSGECYEQGVMNQLLRGRFSNDSCVISPPLISNAPAGTIDDTAGSLIIHRYGNKDEGVGTFQLVETILSRELPIVPSEKPLKCCILLTVYGEPDRLTMYAQVLRKWCNLTNLPIFVIDSYDEEGLLPGHGRYIYKSYREREKNTSKAENNALRVALATFGPELTQYDLICKVTGKYWIPGLKESLQFIPSNADLVVQHRTETCGQNSEVFAIRPSLVPLLNEQVLKPIMGMERGIHRLKGKKEITWYKFPVFALEQPVQRTDGSVMTYL